MSNGRDWLPTDTQELRRLAAAGWDDGAIGRKMNRDRTFIVRKRAAHHIERGQSAGMTAMMARINLQRMARRARA